MNRIALVVSDESGCTANTYGLISAVLSLAFIAVVKVFFFFNDTATTEIYTSLK